MPSQRLASARFASLGALVQRNTVERDREKRGARTDLLCTLLRRSRRLDELGDEGRLLHGGWGGHGEAQVVAPLFAAVASMCAERRTRCNWVPCWFQRTRGTSMDGLECSGIRQRCSCAAGAPRCCSLARGTTAHALDGASAVWVEEGLSGPSRGTWATGAATATGSIRSSGPISVASRRLSHSRSLAASAGLGEGYRARAAYRTSLEESRVRKAWRSRRGRVGGDQAQDVQVQGAGEAERRGNQQGRQLPKKLTLDKHMDFTRATTASSEIQWHDE